MQPWRIYVVNGPAAERFKAEVVALLSQFRLVVPRPGGLAVTAFANRFRAEPTLVDQDTSGDKQQAMF